MPKFEWYKRNPAQFIGGTIGLTFEQKGAYSIVLDLLYDKEGKLPNDSRWIAGILGLSTKRWNMIRGQLIEADKLYLDADGFLRNRRVDSQFKIDVDAAKTEKRPDIKSRKSPDKSPQKQTRSNNPNGLTPLTRARAPSRGESEEESEREGEALPLVPSREEIEAHYAELHRLLGFDGNDRENWLALNRLVVVSGYSRSDIDQAAKIAASRGKNSLRYVAGILERQREELGKAGQPPDLAKAAQQAAAARASQAAHPETVDFERWRIWMRTFVVTGIWDGVGPTPVDEGCLAPPDIIEAGRKRWVATRNQPEVPCREWQRPPTPFFGDNVVPLRKAL